MASLFNTRISDTYQGLIKTIDNAAITATLKELTDGSGNATGVYLNNAGDFKVTAILEFGSLKDTGENIIISKFVDAADGVLNNDNDTSIPTTAAIIDYVQGHVTLQDLDFEGDTGNGSVDLDSQLLDIAGTANQITTVASNQTLTISFNSSGVILPDGSTATTQAQGDNSTKVATTAYVDILDAASDLDFSGDSGTGDVNLNTQTFAVTGTTNQIVTSASGQGLSLSLPATVHRNLQGDVTGNVVGDITGTVNSTSVLADGVTATTQASSDDSTKVATTAYVKSLNNASDLDFTTDSGSGAVILNSQTLSVIGTTNEIITSAQPLGGQVIQIGLPSTINVNLQGNTTGTHTGAVVGNVTGDVVGDLTGNADTASKWQTARNLLLTGQATGQLTNVDGTNNVSAAVTLDNNSVTGKVLTGLASPSASSVLATDTILEGFGKLQSQVNGLANGLRFIGSWDADTNSPVLSSGGGEAANGTTTSTSANKLVDSSASFTSTVTVGDKVVNQVDGQSALVTNVDSNTTLSLDADIMLSGEAYTIDNSPFITQGHYYVVSVGGTTTLNGVSNWSVGDWVIAGANNQWTKLDHSQVDGTGTTGKLTKWSSTQVIADSIVSESGSTITVDGAFTTNTNLSVVGTSHLDGDVTIGDTSSAFIGMARAGANYLAATNASGELVFRTGGTSTALSLNNQQNAYFSGDVRLLDGKQLNLGSGGNDLTLYHTGGNSYIRNNTGNLEIRNQTSGASDLLLMGQSANGLQTYITLDGSIESIMVNKDILMFNDGNNGKIKFGASQDLQIYHDGSHSYIQDSGTGDLRLKGDYVKIIASNDENMLSATQNGAVELYYDAVKKLETTSTGVSAIGNVVVNGASNSNVSQFALTRTDFSWGIFNETDLRFYVQSGNTTTPNTQVLQLATNGNATFAGNVGIGISPSASFSGVEVLQLGKGMTLMGNTNDDRAAMMANLYLDSNTAFRYVMDGLAGKVAIEDGIITFGTAPSGTAGAVATVTERMRIDSSGVVSVATGNLRLDGTAKLYTNNDDLTISADDNGNGSNGRIMFRTVNSERMRIDSSGRLGLGVTPLTWSTGVGKVVDVMQLNGNGALFTRADNTFLSQNFYYNSSDAGAVIDAGQGSIIQLTAGDIRFSNTTSGGSSGATVSVVERMRINADGTTKFHGNILADVINNSANSANIIYRSGSDTFVGGGTSAQKLIIADNGAVYNSNSTGTTFFGSNNAGNPSNVTGVSNSSFGYGAGNALTSGYENVIIGRDAGGSMTTGFKNVLVGLNAGVAFTTGSRLVAIGTNAAKQLVSDVDNVFVGMDCGHHRVSGVDNTFVGAYANYNQNATGSGNTGIGKAAGYELLNGEKNTYVGRQAGYYNLNNNENTYLGWNAGLYFTSAENTAVGSGALVGNSSGSSGHSNTALGRFAGYVVSTGAANTMIGHQAGIAMTTGNNNTLVGKSSGDSITQGENNTAIGYYTGDEITTGDRNLCLGIAAGSGSSPFQLTTQDNRVVIGDNNITNAYIRVAWTVTSDKRDKTDFGDVPHGLDFVSKLKPTSYNNITDRETKEINGKRKYGFLAQDILELEGDNPVIIDNEDENRLSYQESNLVPVLVKAIQELKAEVDKLKQECKCKN